MNLKNELRSKYFWRLPLCYFLSENSKYEFWDNSPVGEDGLTAEEVAAEKSKYLIYEPLIFDYGLEFVRNDLKSTKYRQDSNLRPSEYKRNALTN